LDRVNVVTVIIICLFLLPVAAGAVRPFTREKIAGGLVSIFDYALSAGALLISLYLVKKVYFGHDSPMFLQIYDWIPDNIKAIFQGNDLLAYAVNVPLLALVFLALFRLAAAPVYRCVIIPLANAIYYGMNSLGRTAKSILGALSQIPRSAFLVFLFASALNFYAACFPSPLLTQWMQDSAVYRGIYENALNPVLNSGIAKKIPVLFNDYFKKSLDRLIPGIEDEYGPSQAPEPSGRLSARQPSGANIKVIEYFNGVTLDEAIKSSPEIDDTAKRITSGAKTDSKKALLIYRWITRNVQYDFDKALKISRDPRGISSGAIVAFNSRKGICFDYSSLYVAMCRAAGVKVRLVTGLGYSGTAWGDHAWNQAYSSEEKRWINVDTTFGVYANYFDSRNFNSDHKDAEIQGEW